MARTNGKKKKRRLRRFLLWLLLLALAAVIVRFFVWPKLSAEATTTYNQYTARTGTISNSLSFSGSVSVKNYETITADNAATVRLIYVEEEQHVKKDDRLMRLSDGTTVKASFDGQVNQIAVEVGDEVSMNASLIQIVDFSNMTVSIRVDEYSISELSVGQDCRVTVTALNQTFDSRISHINRIPSGGGSTAYYTVTAELAVTQDVLPGMKVTVTIPQEEAVDSVILNRAALSFGRDNSAYVLMYDENQVMQQVGVEIGVDNDNYVEIVAGLKEGDTVYKEVQENTSAAASLFSGLASLMGGGNTGGTRNNTRYGPGNMPGYNSNNFGGGTRNRNSGGSTGGFGGMPGGF